MATIVLRSTKGSALDETDYDNTITNLNNDKLDKADATAQTVTSDVTFSGAVTLSAASTIATGTTIGTLTLADGSITDSGGSISFGNENLSTTGIAGIGTASPVSTAKLHIVGTDTGNTEHVSANLIIEDTGTNYLQMLTGGTDTSGIIFGDDAATNDGRITYDHNLRHLELWSAGAQTLICDDNNNVGVGVVTPGIDVLGTTTDLTGKLLHIENTSGAARLAVEGTTGAFLEMLDSGGVANFRWLQLDVDAGLGIWRAMSDSGVVNVDDILVMNMVNGNVGVGEVSPLGRFHVKEGDSGASANATANQIVIEDTTNAGLSILSSTGGYILFGDSASNAIGQLVYNHSTNEFSIVTNSSTALTVSSAQNVGIGATSSARLAVGEDTSGSLTGVFNQTHATNPYGLLIDFTVASPDNNTNYFLQCDDATATRCIIYSDGDLQNHDNAYGAISDSRKKRELRNSNSQWDDIKNLRIRKYKMIDDGPLGKEHIGVVAQELIEDGMDGLVRHNTEKDEYGVVYSILYMKAVKALQEALIRIEALEAAVGV